jgi:cytochrome c
MMNSFRALSLGAALGGLLLCAPAFAQDGATVFKQQCQACHVSAKDARPVLAPNLFGVAGRKAGTTAFTAYSPALKASGLVWDKANLDRFLAAPGKLVPGTRMVIAVPDAARRAALVAYLQSLK